VDKPGVDAIMADLGLGPQSRAEELDVESMIKLAHRALQELSRQT
jgi:hypothetical protein